MRIREPTDAGTPLAPCKDHRQDYLPCDLLLSRSDTDSKTDSRCQWQDERCICTAIDNNCLFRIMVVKADKPENAYPPFRIFKKNFRNQKKLLSGICSIISHTSHSKILQRRSSVFVLTGWLYLRWYS